MSDNLKAMQECGLLPEGEIPTNPVEMFVDHQELKERLEEYTSRALASQQAAHDAEIAKLKDDEFSESKDWKESDISGRIDWLMSRVKSCREDIALLTEQQAECEQRGAVKALEELLPEIHKARDTGSVWGKVKEKIAELRATSKKAE